MKPHKPVTSQRIAHWLRTTLDLSGIDTGTFSAHSTLYIWGYRPPWPMILCCKTVIKQADTYRYFHLHYERGSWGSMIRNDTQNGTERYAMVHGTV